MGVLDGKVALVTGAARGIGRATTRLLAEHGARVVVNDLDPQELKQSAQDLPARAATFAGDLTDPEVPDRLVGYAADEFGQLDIIVNNAGYTWDAVVHKMSDEQFQAMLDVHTIAPFRILRAAAPYLREPAKQERAEGREVFRKVVNVTSTSATMGNAGQANYASAKAGLLGLTRALAREWGQFKINVNAVAFGFIETRLTEPKENGATFQRGDGGEIQLGIPKQLRKSAFASIPLHRPGTVKEAAGAIFFLCSPWSNFVHGEVLHCTGGQFTLTS